MVFTLKDIHIEKIGEEMEWSSLHITIMKNRFRKLLSCEKVGGEVYGFNVYDMYFKEKSHQAYI